MKKCFEIVLVVFLLFIMGCAPVQKQSGQDSLSQAQIRATGWDCETGEGEAPNKDECYLGKAIILEEAGFCEKASESGKEECLTAMKDCEALASDPEKDQCYGQKMQARLNVASSFSLGGDYPGTYCEKMIDPFTKDSCFITIVSFLGEPGLCEKIIGTGQSPFIGPLTKSTCYGEIAKSRYPSFDVCDKIVLPDADPDWCWLNIMRSKVGCVISSFPTEVNGYPTTCYQNEGDPRVNPVETEAIATEDEKHCASIEGKMSRGGCYTLVAVKKGKPEICKNIETAAQRKECLNFVSLAEKDFSICELQESAQDKDWCYDTYGRTILDTNACTRIQDKVLNHDQCIIKIATVTQDSSICEQAQGPDYCYYVIVSTPDNRKDPALCEKIRKDQALHKDCLRLIHEGE